MYNDEIKLMSNLNDIIVKRTSYLYKCAKLSPSAYKHVMVLCIKKIYFITVGSDHVRGSNTLSDHRI